MEIVPRKHSRNFWFFSYFLCEVIADITLVFLGIVLALQGSIEIILGKKSLILSVFFLFILVAALKLASELGKGGIKGNRELLKNENL